MDNAPHSSPNAALPTHWEWKGGNLLPPDFLPLHLELRAAVDTACAAHHLSRRPQTLRGWACHEDGPIRPIRINGRLAWPVAELRRILGVAK